MSSTKVYIIHMHTDIYIAMLCVHHKTKYIYARVQIHSVYYIYYIC